MKNIRKLALGCIVVLLGPLGYAKANSATVTAVGVLFAQSETVGYTTSDFLQDSDSPHPVHFIESERMLRLPFLHMVGSLKMLDPDATSGIEKGYGGFLVGAKNFVGPRSADGNGSLGVIDSERCYIGVLDDKASQPDIEPYFRKANYVSIHGKQVWTWTLPPYEGHPGETKFYAAQIGSSYFVLTNNQSDFETTSGALTSTQTSPTLVKDWDSLSAHPYWVHRNVVTKGYPNDLLSDVASVTLSTDLVTGGKGEAVIQLTRVPVSISSPGAKALITTAPRFDRSLELGDFQPGAREGVWQSTVPIAENAVGAQSLYVTMYFLGFGVVV